jgi:hypothetical protein
MACLWCIQTNNHAIFMLWDHCKLKEGLVENKPYGDTMTVYLITETVTG